jgi:hypothetical protein
VFVETGKLLIYGGTVVLSAVPDKGYRIREWTDNGELVNGDNPIYTIHNFSEAHHVVVTFEIIAHTVTFSSLNSQGTITASVDNRDITSGTTVQYDKTVIFTAIPADGYRVKEWTDNGITVNGTNTTYTISGLEEAHTITVDFELIAWPVTFSVTGINGFLLATVDDMGISSGDMIPQGKEIVFMATPAIGYSVMEWTLNGAVMPEYTSNRFRLANLTEATDITVEFDVTILLLRYGVNGGNGTKG